MANTKITSKNKFCKYCNKPLYGKILKDGITWIGQFYCTFCGKPQLKD